MNERLDLELQAHVEVGDRLGDEAARRRGSGGDHGNAVAEKIVGGFALGRVTDGLEDFGAFLSQSLAERIVARASSGARLDRWIDEGRVQKDYELVQTYLGMEKPFAVETAFSTKLLDPSIKMDASKVKK